MPKDGEDRVPANMNDVVSGNSPMFVFLLYNGVAWTSIVEVKPALSIDDPTVRNYILVAMKQAGDPTDMCFKPWEKIKGVDFCQLEHTLYARIS